MSNDWKTGEGSWVTTPDGVTISQHMIAMAVEFVNRHTDAMPPMLVHEIKKHLAAQAQMVTRICEMSARPTPENGLREALEPFARLADEIDRVSAAHGDEPESIIRRVHYADVVTARNAYEGHAPSLPDDVRALVIAAREFWDIHDSPVEPESRALDQALEAFASRVPFADEPALSQAPR